MSALLRNGDFGGIIRRRLLDQDGAVIDISGGDTLEFNLVDPDGNASTLTAAFTNTGTDGKIQYVWATGIIDQEGGWKCNFKIDDTGLSDLSDADRRVPGGGESVMPKTAVEIGFPAQGMKELFPYARQEPGTSPDLLNVVPFDSKGLLRGNRRPGLKKWSSAQVNGTAIVQSVFHMDSTHVSSVVNPSNVLAVTYGDTSSATGFAIFDTAGTETAITTTHSPMGATFGSDGRLYCVTSTLTAVYVECFSFAGSPLAYQISAIYVTQVSTLTRNWVNTNFDLMGLCEDSGIVYLYLSSLKIHGNKSEIAAGFINNTNGIIRVRASDGKKLEGDAVTGVFIQPFGPPFSQGSTTNASILNLLDVRDGQILYGSGGASGSLNDAEFHIADAKTGQRIAQLQLGTLTTAWVLTDCKLLSDGNALVTYNTGGTDFLSKFPNESGSTTLFTVAHATSVGTNGVCEWLDAGRRPRVAIAGSNFNGTGYNLYTADMNLGYFSQMGLINGTYPGPMEVVHPAKDGGLWVWAQGQKKLYHLDKDLAVTAAATQSLNSTIQRCVGSSNFLNSGHTAAGVSDIDVVIAVSDGTVSKMTTVTSATVTNGAAALAVGVFPIYTATCGGFLFFADGSSQKYYDPIDNEMKPWIDSLNHGRLPENFRQCTCWNDRVVLFDLGDDEQNWYMSQKGDPFDWAIGMTATWAMSARKSEVGLFPDRIQAMVPYDNNLLIMGGLTHIRQFSGDPSTAGGFRMDHISDTVGMAPGNAWCKDSFGNVWFVGAAGGLYRLQLNVPPARISANLVDERLLDIDTTTNTITLAWDEVEQGVWIFVRPDSVATVDQWFYSMRTEGLFRARFTDSDYIPMSVSQFDDATSDKQKLLIGGSDGYIRYGDADEHQDDGADFESYYVAGPYVPDEGLNKEVKLGRMEVSLGKDSQVKVEVMKAETPELVIEASMAIDRETTEPVTLWAPNVSGRSVAVKVRATKAQPMAVDKIRIELTEVTAG